MKAAPITRKAPAGQAADISVAVYDGAILAGTIVEHADSTGFDAPDTTGKLIGTFATRLAASRVIPVGGAEHVPALIVAIEAAAASPEAGFRRLEDEPELDLEPAPERIEDVPQPEPIVDQPDRRELIRAALLAGDKSNRQIAAELNCSEATVRRAAATLTAAECDSQCDSAATDAGDDARLTHMFENGKADDAQSAIGPGRHTPEACHNLDRA